MAHIEVKDEICKGCGLCVTACTFKLIELGTKLNSKGYNPAVQNNPEKCVGCTLWAKMCPDIAIKVFK